MGLPEKIAYLKFHHYGNLLSLNNVLYQFGLRNGELADEIGKKYFYKAMDAYSMLSKEDKEKLEKMIKD